MVPLSQIPRVVQQDPVAFARCLWPDVRLYGKQREILHSVRDNFETVVVAGNMLGKDFVAGLCCLWFFLTHHPVRIVTTSVKDDHLRVLWGEIGRFISTSKVALRATDGGQLVINHRDIRKLVRMHDKREQDEGRGKFQLCDISYMLGMVSERGEGMAGHHAAWTLGIIDEASGVEDMAYTQMATWAKRILVFGNANACPHTHFFRKAVREGDLLAPEGTRV